jgi:hypothetical protein
MNQGRGHEARRMEERVFNDKKCHVSALNDDIAGSRWNIGTYFAVTGWLKRPS